jgi:uncharacterized membrane protein (DUF106 family)
MMTDEQKKEWFKQIVSFVVITLSAIIITSWTVIRENKKTTNTEIQNLKINKADVTYVDEKCKEVKELNNSQYNDLKSDIREMREVQNKMYEILSNKR